MAVKRTTSHSSLISARRGHFIIKWNGPFSLCGFCIFPFILYKRAVCGISMYFRGNPRNKQCYQKSVCGKKLLFLFPLSWARYYCFCCYDCCRAIKTSFKKKGEEKIDKRKTTRTGRWRQWGKLLRFLTKKMLLWEEYLKNRDYHKNNALVTNNPLPQKWKILSHKEILSLKRCAIDNNLHTNLFQIFLSS